MSVSPTIVRRDPEAYARQLVPSPRALHFLRRLLGFALLVVLVALFVVPWQQTAVGAGRIVAFEPYDRAQTVAAPVTGRVRNVWVREGSRVEAGDRLIELVDNDPAFVERLQQQRTALVAQLDAATAKSATYGAQVGSLEQARELAIAGAESAVAVAEAKVESQRHKLEGVRAAKYQAELNLQRQRDLFREGLASELEFEVAERTFREKAAELAQTARSLEGAENDLQAKRAKLGQTATEARAKVDSARAQQNSADGDVGAKEQSLASLDVKIAQQSTQLLRAPRAGTVFRLFAAPGAEIVKAGDPLAVLIPETGEPAAELWIDGNDVPLVQPGRSVRLQFEGWPSVQFSGWPSVAVGTFGGRVAVVDSSDDGTGRFRILVLPDEAEPAWPDADHLRQGARAKGFVLLDTVALGYELWRLANGFPATITGAPDSEKPPTAPKKAKGKG